MIASFSLLELFIAVENCHIAISFVDTKRVSASWTWSDSNSHMTGISCMHISFLAYFLPPRLFWKRVNRVRRVSRPLVVMCTFFHACSCWRQTQSLSYFEGEVSWICRSVVWRSRYGIIIFILENESRERVYELSFAFFATVFS